MAWIIPKTDWNTNPINPTSIDFNRIEGNIEFLLSEIENKKGGIVDAINNNGGTATLESSYADLVTQINNISAKYTSGEAYTIHTISSVPRIYGPNNLYTFLTIRSNFKGTMRVYASCSSTSGPLGLSNSFYVKSNGVTVVDVWGSTNFVVTRGVYVEKGDTLVFQIHAPYDGNSISVSNFKLSVNVGPYPTITVL